jgi:methylphosphonate synthase
MLNDLKRDHVTAAAELDISPELLSRALVGEVAAAGVVRSRASLRWPVSARDLHLREDDVSGDVLVWEAARSIRSTRTIERGGRPYYEYRDTAMARVSPIRPEWIRMLVQTRDCNPHGKDLSWNRGHALHQLTFFLGDVDFYYERGGRRVGDRMRRGDSALIPSWVAHTFTAVEGGADPVILAVTFPGRVTGDAIEDLRSAGSAFRSGDLPDASSPWSLFASMLRARLDDASLTLERVCADAGIEADRMRCIAEGADAPQPTETEAIAAALRVSPRDIGGAGGHHAEVLVERAEQRPFDPFPVEGSACRIRQLAGSQLTPDARGVELELGRRAGDAPGAEFRFGLHHYGFVVGAERVEMRWGKELDHRAVLQPGDSFYMKPWVRHAFAPAGETQVPACLVSFRCAGSFNREALLELAVLGTEGAARYLGEQGQWYD